MPDGEETEAQQHHQPPDELTRVTGPSLETADAALPDGKLASVLQATASPADLVAAKVEHFPRRFVVLTDAQAAVVALFVVHTHLVDAAVTSPCIAVTSAEKQSGKTRLLEALGLLVARPLRAAGRAS